jgi:flagellar assembly factor FliW
MISNSMTALATMTEIPTINFSGGLPGFPDARTFVLMNTELAQEPFSIMKCLEDDSLEFVVTTPVLFFPDYAPEIDDATVARIGITSGDDALLLVLLEVGDEAIDITANLMGPIVVNKHTNAAAQAVLSGQGYELREPLFSKELRESVKDSE